MVADYTLNNLAGLSLGWRPNSFGGSGASYKQAESQKSNSSARIKSFRAGTGRDAGRQFDNGRNGDDVEIRVPPGTTVQQEVEILDEFGNVTSTELIEVGQVTSDDPTLVVAKGGNGGDGSGVTRRSIVKGIKRRRAPPASGERKKLILVLKLVADIALVGVPNAGKSTFLASVTRAKPKIANVS
jgi:GTP-binding protein